MKWQYLVILLFFLFTITARDIEDDEFIGQEDEGEFIGEQYDENSDEFVGEGLDKDTKKVKDEEIIPKVVEVEIPQVWYKKYLYEIIFGLIALIFVIQAYRGQKYNKTMVAAWLGQNIDFFKEQFAAIGIEHPKEGETPKQPNFEGETILQGAFLEQHSYNMFKFYATGRVNCDYCLVSFELKRRQDLFTMIAFNILWPEVDKVVYEFPLALADPFPCVFSVVRRNEMKALLEENKLLVSLYLKCLERSYHTATRGRIIKAIYSIK